MAWSPHGPLVSTPRAGNRPSRSRRSLIALLLAGSAFAAAPARADEPPASGATAAPPPAAAAGTAIPVAPTFVIERIVVEGVRHGSAQVVAAETLLTAGQGYTERQLQQALHRIERLPFVVEADFALRKGTERGRFVLVITVVETKPIFLGGLLGVAGSHGTGYQDWNGGLAPELGGRLFFRGQNEISLTLRCAATLGEATYFEPGFDIGYTHHNLLGRHLVGSVSLGAERAVGQDGGWHDRHGSGELALPLSRSSVVKAGVSLHRFGNDFDYGSPLIAHEDWRSNSDAHLAWQSDTTDDPFTPRQGRRMGASLAYDWGHGNYALSLSAFEPEKNRYLEQDNRGFSATVGGSRFWSLASRLSLGVGASLSAGETWSEGSLTQGGSVEQGSGRIRFANGQLDLTLLGTFGSRPGALTRHWWELTTSLAGNGAENDFTLMPYTPTRSRSTTAAVGLGLALRGRWGLARFRVSYVFSSYESR